MKSITESLVVSLDKAILMDWFFSTNKDLYLIFSSLNLLLMSSSVPSNLFLIAVFVSTSSKK